MPGMLSSFMVSRKHEDSCGLGVPALNSVGVACVNHFSRHQVISLDGRFDVFFVDTHGHAHQHMLRTLHNLAV